MSKQIAIMKLFPSLEIAGCINELLRELQSRGDYILDYENCDMSLDHVEYHKAEDIDGEKFGDVSDKGHKCLKMLIDYDKQHTEKE